MSERPVGKERAAQLEYSEFQSAMLDEAKRRRKAAKIIAVLAHFLGRDTAAEGAKAATPADGGAGVNPAAEGAKAATPADAGADGGARVNPAAVGVEGDNGTSTDAGPGGALAGLTVADIGCSAGFIADELAMAGADRTFGVDIDVPGLRKASERFGKRVEFVCADGSALPFPDGSVDVLVFNHIYEHVVDPDAVIKDMHRVLADDGVLYLGLGNRLGVMEPHYKLPFLSYLPPGPADRYVRAFGRADHYYERFRTRSGLRRMLRDFHVWDYTFPVLASPERFAGGELFPGTVGRVAKGALEQAPRAALRALLPVVPTYLWVATKTPARPKGSALPQPPEPVRTP